MASESKNKKIKSYFVHLAVYIRYTLCYLVH